MKNGNLINQGKEKLADEVVWASKKGDGLGLIYVQKI
jgi:hypothetical protein